MPNRPANPLAGPAPKVPWHRRLGRRWIVSLSVLVVAAGALTVTAGVLRSGPKDTARAEPGATVPIPGPQGGSAGSPSAGASASTSASPSASAAPSRSAGSPQKPPKTSGGGGPGIPNRPGCGDQPSSCGLPDASNTGVPAGTQLTVFNGNMTIKKAGTVVDGKDIRGCVSVEAPRVTIKRSRVSCPDFYVISSFSDTYTGGGLILQNVEIDCQHTNGTGVGSYGVVAQRLNVHGCENGFDIDNTFTVTDSYIHDLNQTSAGHPDGIQLAGGAHITITHNTIFDPGGTSAIISNPSQNSDVLIQNNLMAGGAYTLYCPRDSSSAFRVIGNRFSTRFSPNSGEYGPWSDCEKVAVVTGNVWDATLRPVAFT
ncbi:MAG TPA: hypothetical protein VJT31_26595 [Rugosimonospora sp.]|nr:hypothetical protein [Rugosimonospora sp.]